jgi:protein tyrosine/serine phosphatase
MTRSFDRHVVLDGCFNFRDLGGYLTHDGRRVRRGRLFRSDGLHELSARDVAHLREQLRIRDVIDLRTPSEVRSDLQRALIAPPVRYHHVSLLEVEESQPRQLAPGETFELDRFYVAMMRRGSKGVARVLELIANASDPAVFHCAAGKDRTGVVAALVLALLGVDDAQIAEDYALTQRGLKGIAARLRRTRGYTELWRDLPPETLHARAETMHAWLARVRDEWGSPQGYAEAAGVSSGALDQLRDRLLE